MLRSNRKRRLSDAGPEPGAKTKRPRGLADVHHVYAVSDPLPPSGLCGLESPFSLLQDSFDLPPEVSLGVPNYPLEIVQFHLFDGWDTETSQSHVG